MSNTDVVNGTPKQSNGHALLCNGTPKHGAKVSRNHFTTQNTLMAKSSSQNDLMKKNSKGMNLKNVHSDESIEAMCSTSFIINALKNLFDIEPSTSMNSPTRKGYQKSKLKDSSNSTKMHLSNRKSQLNSASLKSLKKKNQYEKKQV